MPTPTPPPTSPGSRTAPLVLGTVSLVSAMLLLFGALQRSVLGTNPVWEAWLGAAPVLRFTVILAVLGGLLGAGSVAIAMTWRREGYLDLLGSSSFLLAGIALVVGATHRPQYGASNAMPLLMGLLLAGGFVATLVSAMRRSTRRAAANAASAAPPPREAEPETVRVRAESVDPQA